MAKDKVQHASDFIIYIRNASPEVLADMINHTSTVELAEFFSAYGQKVVDGSPKMAGQSAGSLMLMGYLIMAFEDKVVNESPPSKDMLN